MVSSYLFVKNYNSISTNTWRVTPRLVQNERSEILHNGRAYAKFAMSETGMIFSPVEQIGK